MKKPKIAGIDVAKAHLDVAVLDGDEWRTENTPEKIAALGQELIRLKVEMVVVEASGGYEQKLLLGLRAMELSVKRINPTLVRRFAQAYGVYAKTDRIDARMLVEFGVAIPIKSQYEKTAEEMHLSALFTRRKQLIKNRNMEISRLETAFDAIQEDIVYLIDVLNLQIEKFDFEITQFKKSTPEWIEATALIESVPGVGPVTSTVLLAEMPELGQISHKAAAALIGVAPYNQDSGTKEGRRHIFGGRATVRSTLYMATLSAIRCNPKIKTFYERLRDAGKEFKVAMIACARKLLTFINAILKSQEPWTCSVA